MPFGTRCEFPDFDACVATMQGKVDDPEGFCAKLMRETEAGCAAKARLIELNKERDRAERVYMERAHPQWTARFEERKADETRVRRRIYAVLRKALAALGTPKELAETGRRLWEGVQGDPTRRPVVKRVLAAELSRRIVAADVGMQEVVDLFVPIARRSQESILAVMGALAKQTVPGWTSADVVFTEGLAENLDEVTRALEGAVTEGYAGDVAAAVVRAADPARPLTISQLASEIRNDTIGITGKKAVTIARTETARVYGANALSAMKKNGIGQRRWLTAAGSPAAATTPVCEYCQAMAAQGWVGVDEPIEGDLMVGAREPRLVTASAEHPPYHPSCRCDIAADTEGWLLPGGVEPEPEGLLHDVEMTQLSDSVDLWKRGEAVEAIQRAHVKILESGKRVVNPTAPKNALDLAPRFRAAQLSNGIREAERFNTLYRGMFFGPDDLEAGKAAAKFLEGLQQGKSITLPISSFSKDLEIAAHYAGERAATAFESGFAQSIMLEARGPRGLDMAKLTGKSISNEVLSAGQFKVISVDRTGNNALRVVLEAQ